MPCLPAYIIVTLIPHLSVRFCSRSDHQSQLDNVLFYQSTCICVLTHLFTSCFGSAACSHRFVNDYNQIVFRANYNIFMCLTVSQLLGNLFYRTELIWSFCKLYQQYSVSHVHSICSVILSRLGQGNYFIANIFLNIAWFSIFLVVQIKAQHCFMHTHMTKQLSRQYTCTQSRDILSLYIVFPFILLLESLASHHGNCMSCGLL